MTITPGRKSKYVFNQDSSVPWVSDPIRIGTLQGVAFQFYANANTVHGVLTLESAIDFYDDSPISLSPKLDPSGDPIWTPTGATFAIVAGLFTNGLASGNSEQLSGGGGAAFITFMEGFRLRWTPDGGGSVGTIDVSSYAKSFG